jgi:hypothetical protein
VGDWTSEDGNVHGFLLQNGRFTTLDVPGPYWAKAARGITSSGTIVGEVEEAETFADHGFIKTDEGYELVDYPGTVGTTFVERINDRGEARRGLY